MVEWLYTTETMDGFNYPVLVYAKNDNQSDLFNSLIPAGLSDLAFGKTAFQNTSYSAYTGASNAVDGNDSTYAQTAYVVDPWWYVDLGEFVLVEYLQITHHQTQGKIVFNTLILKGIQYDQIIYGSLCFSISNCHEYIHYVVIRLHVWTYMNSLGYRSDLFNCNLVLIWNQYRTL